jgi:hypothetical protein
MYHSSPVKKSTIKASFTAAKYANQIKFGGQIHRGTGEVRSSDELEIKRPPAVSRCQDRLAEVYALTFLGFVTTDMARSLLNVVLYPRRVYTTRV